MGNSKGKHNINVLKKIVQGDILKVPGEQGWSYYLYSGDASKLYPLNEETKKYFCNPLTRNDSRPTVTFQEAVRNFKCYQISESQWIYETEGKIVDVPTYNKKLLQVLLPGDIVKLSCHNVLYIGDGQVVHLVSSISICARLTAKHKKELEAIPDADGLITKDKFLKLAKNKKAYKNNRRDLIGYSTNKIIKRAESQIGPASFSFLIQNCGHFVQEMKYGWQVYKKVRSFGIGKDASALVDEGGFDDDQPAKNSQSPASKQQYSDKISFQEIELDDYNDNDDGYDDDDKEEDGFVLVKKLKV